MARKKTTKATPKRSKPDWAPAFLAALADTGNISAAATLAGINRTTFYRRRDDDEAFAKAVSDALETACDSLELEARRRALAGVPRKKFDKGLPIIDPDTGEQYVEREYSDTLMIFLLKGHRPEKYRENVRHEVGGDGGGPIKVQVYVPDNGRDQTTTGAAGTVPVESR